MKTFRPSKRYLSLCEQLYGSATQSDQPKKKTSPRACNELKTEDEEQFQLVKWLRDKNIPFYHVPNQRRTTVQYGAKLKRLGVSAGVPDLVITCMRGGYGGLYIELKRVKGGVLSESQALWRDTLIREGYAWYMALGAEHGKVIVKQYLGEL